MACEICGKQIFGKGGQVFIDGAKLTVCFDCTRFVSSPPPLQDRFTEVKKTHRVPKIRSAPRTEQVDILEDLELVENYNSLVRKSREKMHLTHDDLGRKTGIKISILQKLETGKMVPDQDLSKRLEHALKIKLFQPTIGVKVDERFTKKPFGLTLGDLILTEKKKNSTPEEESQRVQ